MAIMKTARLIFPALILFLFILSGISFAAEKVFIKEYTYQASEIDSKVTSRAIALEQAKRLVLEELGTYLISETEVKNFKLTKDRVVILTAGAVQTEILDEKWNGEKYYLKARIKADPAEVAKSIDRLRNDEGKSKELENVKKRADNLSNEIERLKVDNEALKNDKSKQREYTSKVNSLSATDWFEKGYDFYNHNDDDRAIEAYSKAIELDPYYAKAYYGRGIAYHDKGTEKEKQKILKEKWYDMGIEDLNKAISLKPDYAEAYDKRAGIYFEKNKKDDRALADANKACELGSKAGCDTVPFFRAWLRKGAFGIAD